MARTETSGQRNRILKIALAGVAALVAVRAFRRGDRARGALAGLGAVALGYSARSDTASEATAVDVEDVEPATSVADEDTDATVSIETPGESEAKLRCAACGEPIVPGQRRGPDEHDRTVHEACLQAAA